MKLFIAHYDESWRYGGYECGTLLVSANTESEALGVVLESRPHLKSGCWLVEPCEPSNKAEVIDTLDWDSS